MNQQSGYKYLQSGILICILSLSMANYIDAGERPALRREDMLQIYQGLDDPLLELRVSSIRNLGEMTDNAEMVKEFSLNEKLMEIAKGTDRIPRVLRERKESLKALNQLYVRGFGSNNLVPTLVSLVEEKRRSEDNTPLPLRLFAFDILAEIGAPKAKADPNSIKAFNALKTLSTTRDLPPVIYAKIYQALGSMYSADNSGIRKLLIDGIKNSSPEIRAGALSGLTIYLQANTGSQDRAVRDELTSLLLANRPTRTDRDKSLVMEEKIQAMRTMNVLNKNMIASLKRNETFDPFNSNARLRDYLLTTFDTGSENEAAVALPLLLQGAVNDVDLVNILISSTTMTHKPPRSPELRLAIMMSLTNVLSTLPQWKDLKNAKAQKMIDDIVVTYISLLNPALRSQVPEPVRITSIFGLSLTPQDSTRYMEALQLLVSILEMTENPATPTEITEICESLENMTGQATEYIRNLQTGDFVVNVPAWRSYIDELKDKQSAPASRRGR